MSKTSGKGSVPSGKSNHLLFFIRGAYLALLIFLFPRETAIALKEEDGFKRGFYEISKNHALFEKMIERCKGQCCDAIKNFASKGELDPLIIYAIIYTESSFKRFAISNKGAIGIVQVNPDVGREVAYELGIPFSEELLFDCEYNLKIGIHYFKKMLEIFNDIELAFVAYNMGPTYIFNKIKNKEFISRKYLSRIEKLLEEVKSYED